MATDKLEIDGGGGELSRVKNQVTRRPDERTNVRAPGHSGPRRRRAKARELRVPSDKSAAGTERRVSDYSPGRHGADFTYVSGVHTSRDSARSVGCQRRDGTYVNGRRFTREKKNKNNSDDNLLSTTTTIAVEITRNRLASEYEEHRSRSHLVLEQINSEEQKYGFTSVPMTVENSAGAASRHQVPLPRRRALCPWNKRSFPPFDATLSAPPPGRRTR